MALSVHMKMALKKAFQEDGSCADIQDPYAVLVRIMEQVITLYDDSIWAIRNHVCLSEATRPDEPDYPLLHEIARHAIHVGETLAVALDTMETIQQQHLEFREMQVDDDKAGRTRRIRICNALRSQHGILKALMNRCESNTQRVQNEIALAFNIGAQRESRIQARMAEAAAKETTSMKAIALVTMTFLPATFVSSIFSMSFFSFEPASNGKNHTFVVSDKFWMYWLFAIPLSVATHMVWFFWEARLKKKA